MRVRQHEWDGLQPREHVIAVLKRYGVKVYPEGGDFFELVDKDGDPVVQDIPDPVPPDIIVFLYRRFGELHGFQITELHKKLH